MMRSRGKYRPIIAPFSRRDIGQCREHPCGGACLNHKMRISNRKLQEAFWRIERQKIVVLEPLTDSIGVGIRAILQLTAACRACCPWSCAKHGEPLERRPQSAPCCGIDSEPPRKPPRATP